MELSAYKEKLKKSIEEGESLVIENRNSLMFAQGYCYGMSYALQLADDDQDEEDEEE